jgi:hypothetical protein
MAFLVSPQVAQQASKNASLVCPAGAHCTVERIIELPKLSSKGRASPAAGRPGRCGRVDLERKADAILEGAGCDTVTGAKKDRRYRRNKIAKRRRLARLWRARRKKLGKFGAASPVRIITPDGC